MHVADRIELAAFVAPVLRHALHEHRVHGRETLSVTFHLDAIGALPAGGAKYREDEIDGHPVKFCVKKAESR